jgi:hypothetical protein
MNNLFQRDNSDKMLTATAQAPNPDPISIWQISLLEDLMANYLACRKSSGAMIQMSTSY